MQICVRIICNNLLMILILVRIHKYIFTRDLINALPCAYVGLLVQCTYKEHNICTK